MTAIELFKHEKPSDLLAKAVTLRSSATGAMRLGLLPAKSKDGPDLRQASGGLTGQALKRWKRERQAEFKVTMSREFAGLSADPQYLGRSVTVSKSGVLGFFLEPSGVSPEEAAKIAEAEDRAKTIEAENESLKAELARLKTLLP
jgi:hypothetical protein